MYKADQKLFHLGLLDYKEEEEEHGESGSAVKKTKKIKSVDTPLLGLEHVMLKMATGLQQTLCKGILYVLILPVDEKGYIPVRFIESGKYMGWMEKSGKALIGSLCNSTADNVIAMRTFTQQDFDVVATSKPTKTGNQPPLIAV